MEKGITPTSQSVQLKDDYNLELGKKGKIKGENNLVVVEDRISEFPDEVLVSIVSLLPLKEAVATSILSRRWRYVWVSTMTLNFETVNFEDPNNVDRFLSLEEELTQLRDQESRSFVDWVNRVVDQHRGQSIERFRACFFLKSGFKSSIDKWIQFALEKRVQILELELFADTEDNYTFPHKLLLGLEKGSASKQLFSDIPSCGYNIGLKRLKVVRFQHVGVTGEVLEYFLSNCPVLEQLSIGFAKGLVSFKVSGPSIALKYLAIKCCPELEKIEICDTNIVSFSLFGSLIDLQFSNVPLLVEVSINSWSRYSEFIRVAFSQLSCCLSHIETLKLDIRGAVYNQNHVIPKLANLKHLELSVDADYCWSLHHLTCFLNAAPYLRTLVLGLSYKTSNVETAKIEKAAKCPHHYLKVVEISGYRGHPCYVKHVMYLKKNAVALEKIVINPGRLWCQPPRMYSNFLGVNEEENARDHANQYLKQKLPSTVQFVCL